jgi:hypothetical protein
MHIMIIVKKAHIIIEIKNIWNEISCGITQIENYFSDIIPVHDRRRIKFGAIMSQVNRMLFYS